MISPVVSRAYCLQNNINFHFVKHFYDLENTVFRIDDGA